MYDWEIGTTLGKVLTIRAKSVKTQISGEFVIYKLYTTNSTVVFAADHNTITYIVRKDLQGPVKKKSGKIQVLQGEEEVNDGK